MIGPEFASCWLKMGRAEEHFNTIKTELLSWIAGKPYLMRKENDSEGSRYSVFIEIRNQPRLDRWSLIAGDCIHNLRSALDSLIYALAIKESGINPPPKAGILQFPIAISPEKFAEQRNRIASLSTQTQARIERAQPYNRVHPQLPPLIWLLSEFDNLDKHRLLNVVFANMGQGKFSKIVLDASDMIVTPPRFGYYEGPIKSGAEVAYFIMTPPKRGVNYEHEASFVISIGHPAGPSGRTFGELSYILEILIAEVKRIVEQMIL